MKRLFTTEKFSKFASYVAGIYAFLELLQFVVVVFILKQTSFNTILNYAISIIFYIFICSYFIKSSSNFFFAFYAILALIISDYVIPAIFGLLSSALNLQFYVMSIGVIVGILYFIFMALENKQRKKTYITVLIVLGSIFLVLGISSFVLTIIEGVMSIGSMLSGMTNMSFDNISNLIVIIVNLLLSLTSVCFSFIYFAYPIILKKIR